MTTPPDDLLRAAKTVSDAIDNLDTKERSTMQDLLDAQADLDNALGAIARAESQPSTITDAQLLRDAETVAWEALGKPEGTHETSNVVRLAGAYTDLLRKQAPAPDALL